MIKWLMLSMIWSGKIVFAFLIILCFNSCSDIETKNEELIVIEPVVANCAIIPKPEHLYADSGFFLLNSSVVIVVDDRFSTVQELNNEVDDLQNFAKNKLGFELEQNSSLSNNPTVFLSIIPYGLLEDEAYRIRIDSNILTIESRHPSGIA